MRECVEGVGDTAESADALREQSLSSVEEPTDSTRQASGQRTDVGSNTFHRDEPHQRATSTQTYQRAGVWSPNVLQLSARILASRNQQGKMDYCIIAKNPLSRLSYISQHCY